MTQLATATQQANEVVERFARFWADPHPEALRGGVTDDVALFYPGATDPLRGPETYVASVQRYLDLVPDLRLEVAEYAYNGDCTFIRWIAHGTGVDGPFEMPGMDRIRTRDGLVAENRVLYDTATFRRLAGGLP